MWSTLTGLVLLLGGLSSAMAAFNQNAALLPYSCWNHPISELGFPYASARTWMFNGGLAIGGLMFLPLYHALGALAPGGLGRAARVCGFLGGLSLSGLGMLGLREDVLQGPYSFVWFLGLHMVLAFVFFLACTAGITLFAIHFHRGGKAPWSRRMALAGMACALVYLTFLVVAVWPNPTHAALAKDLKALLEAPPTTSPLLSLWFDSHRPPVLWPAVLEWLWAGVALIWHGIAAVGLRFLDQRGQGIAALSDSRARSSVPDAGPSPRQRALLDAHLGVVDGGLALVAGVVGDVQDVIMPDKSGMAAVAAAGQLEDRGEAACRDGKEYHVRARGGAEAA